MAFVSLSNIVGDGRNSWRNPIGVGLRGVRHVSCALKVRESGFVAVQWRLCITDKEIVDKHPHVIRPMNCIPGER
jgi:hypothetical protein